MLSPPVIHFFALTKTPQTIEFRHLTLKPHNPEAYLGILNSQSNCMNLKFMSVNFDFARVI